MIVNLDGNIYGQTYGSPRVAELTIGLAMDEGVNLQILVTDAGGVPVNLDDFIDDLVEAIEGISGVTSVGGSKLWVSTQSL